MARVLFVIPVGGGLPVFGYGLFLMLGFIVGLLLVCRRARKAGLSVDAAVDVGLISIVAGVVGARAAYLLLDYHPAEGIGTPLEWLAVWQGGLTFQGGLALALAATFCYLKWKKISIGRMFDIYAPALAVGVGFGRIGCLMNGCCWGRIAPNGSFFAMFFPEDSEVMASQYRLLEHDPLTWAEIVRQLGYPADATPLLPVYATQIISVLGLFLIAAGLVWAERRWTNRPPGQVIVWFLIAYGVGRFLIEFWRDDTPLRYGFGAFAGFKLGQWLALAMIAAGIVCQVFLSGKKTVRGFRFGRMSMRLPPLLLCCVLVLGLFPAMAGEGEEFDPRVLEIRRHMDVLMEKHARTMINEQSGQAERADAALAIGAFYELGMMGDPNPLRAATYYRTAAELGSPEANCALGNFYSIGVDGADGKLERDSGKARECYRLAAEAGSVPAMVKLGEIYSDGIGVEPDSKQALGFFLDAAKRGDPEAIRRLEPVMRQAREWEAARPGRKSNFPTNREALIVADLAKAERARSERLGRNASHIYVELNRRIGASAKEDSK